MKNLKLKKKITSICLLSATITLSSLSGCAKKMDCDIETEHAHKYVSEEGYFMYKDSEYETKDDMTWTDEQIVAAGADPEKYYLKDWSKVSRWQITKDEGLKLLENKGKVCLQDNETGCVNINSGDIIGDFLTVNSKNDCNILSSHSSSHKKYL